jgi:hypothetical protein
VVDGPERGVEATDAAEAGGEGDIRYLERRPVEQELGALNPPRPGDGARRRAAVLDEQSGEMARPDAQRVSEVGQPVLVKESPLDERKAPRDGRS